MFKTLVCGESTWEVSLLGVIGKEEGDRSFPRREEHPFIPFNGQSSVREGRAEQHQVEDRSA
jgi:hypothetical protein